jgi:hypothetical protein
VCAGARPPARLCKEANSPKFPAIFAQPTARKTETMLTTSLLLTKIVLASTVYFQVAPTAADQLAMARFRTADVEFAREAMAEADWIDAEIARDGDIPVGATVSNPKTTGQWRALTPRFANWSTTPPNRLASVL